MTINARFAGNYCGFTSLEVVWGDGSSSPAEIISPTSRIRPPTGGARPALAETGCGMIYALEHSYAAGQPHANPVLIGRYASTSVEHKFPGFVPLAVRFPEALVGGAEASDTGATLEGEVDPQGSPVSSCQFEWGTAKGSYTGHAECAPSPSDFNLNQFNGVRAAISGLTPATVYYFRLVGTNAAGTAELESQFETAERPTPGAPSTVTNAATNLTKEGVTLHGEVNPNGHTLESCAFEWGTDASYGHTLPCTPGPPLDGTSMISVSATLVGLSPDTTYHFRLAAANRGSSISHGSDASLTTPPSCESHVTFGYVDAKGCFKHSGSTYVSTAGSPVSLDGLTLTPDSSGTSVTLDPANYRVGSSGSVRLTASEVTLADGVIVWVEPKTDGVDPAKLAELAPPTGAGVGGLAFQGKLSLALNYHDGADLAGNIELPLGKIASGLGINGTVTLHTTDGAGLQHDQITAVKENLEIAGVGVKKLRVAYSPTDDLWEGGAEAVLPTPNPVTISAALAFEHGKFHRFAGSVEGINAPVGPGVFLQKVAVVFGVEPTTFGGGLGVSFGPEIQDVALVYVEGDFLWTSPFGQEPGHFHANGELKIVGVKAATGYFDYFTNGLMRFGAQEQIGLPDAIAPEPKKEPVFIEFGLNGALDDGKFDALAKADVHLNFIETEVAGEALVSDKGLAGCAHLKSEVLGISFSWSPGFGYTWANRELDLMWRKCSVGQWQTLELGPVASSARAARRISLPGGGALLGLTGATAAPQATIEGPEGQTISVPQTTTKPYMGPGFMVFQDTADKVTYIAVKRSAGAWKLQLEQGSSPIVHIRQAPLLPEPAVSGSITGSGRSRTLSWHAKRIAGQTIVFWEKGRNIDRPIGSSAASSGRLQFSAANGHGGRRLVVAQIVSYGLPRQELTVSSYTAPALSLPGRPRSLRVTSVHGAIRITWVRAPFAARYTVVVETSDGARLVEFTKNGATSIVIRDVVPITDATVTVTGKLSDGVPGPAARARLVPIRGVHR